MGILRLLLALSIVIVHSNGIVGHRVAGAGAGIQAFYLTSGFYMAGPQQQIQKPQLDDL